MSGIPLIHWHSQWLEPIASRKINEKPTHIARPVPEDAEREDAIRAIRAYADASGYLERREAWRRVHAALDRIDERIRGGA